MGIDIVLQQVGILTIIILIGFFAAKTGYVDVKFKDAISKLIVNLLLPCLIISSISAQEFNISLLKDIFLAACLSLLCIFSLFGIGALTAKLFKIPLFTKTVHKLLMTLGNVMFVGYPIVTAMYGENCFIYIMVYWLLNDLFLWTLGVFMLDKNKDSSNGSPIKKLLNPNTISFAVAVVMMIFGIRLPSLLDRAVSGLGNLTTNISMIFIGMTLATVDVRRIFQKWWVFPAALLKLIIMPVIFMVIFKFLGIKETLAGVIVLEAAMPVQTVLSVLANENGADYEYSTVGMFITTILCAVTLPFMCYLLQAI